MEHLQSPARARQGEVEASNPNLDVPPFLDRRNEPTAARGWRDRFKVHPAADLFPMMSEDKAHATVWALSALLKSLHVFCYTSVRK